jgi:hypothetical protein
MDTADTRCVVTVVNQGVRFFLRGTTWAFHLDRANVFADAPAAYDAADKARKFMPPKIRKTYEVWALKTAQREV